MKKLFNACLLLVCAVVLFSFRNEIQAAEEYPTKPIIAICPLQGGSYADVFWRPLCQKAQAVLGQPVVVVNKPGAGSSIGYREIFAAKPDGYTIGYGMATLITNKLQGILPYDYEEFTLLGTFYKGFSLIVASTKTNRPFKTIQEVISFAKANPGEASIAPGAVGQSSWIAAKIFEDAAGIILKIASVANPKNSPVAQAAEGESDLAVAGLSAAKPQVEAGNVRILAVFGDQRTIPPYDHIPTVKELGYDAVYPSFGIIIGPPKLDKNAAVKLIKAFKVAADDEEVKKLLMGQDSLPMYLPPDQIPRYLNEHRRMLKRIFDKVGTSKK
jgi:tripartite-type tricarboxylate transporter receptor subunit TctC